MNDLQPGDIIHVKGHTATIERPSDGFPLGSGCDLVDRRYSPTMALDFIFEGCDDPDLIQWWNGDSQYSGDGFRPIGKRQHAPEVLRERMAQALEVSR